MCRLIVLFILLVSACDNGYIDSTNKRCKDTCEKHNMKWTNLRTNVDDRLFCECRAYFEAEGDKQTAEHPTQNGQ